MAFRFISLIFVLRHFDKITRLSLSPSPPAAAPAAPFLVSDHYLLGVAPLFSLFVPYCFHGALLCLFRSFEN